MDFSLTREQRDIQKAAREFARGEFDPDLALQLDQNQEFPTRIWKKAAELGFLGVHYPVDLGGQGLGLLENVLIIEAFCGQDSGIGMALALSDFGSEIILDHGSAEQKQRVLPFLAQGDGLVTLAFLEEGYSLASFRTVARANNTGYVIDGRKSFVTLGSQAHDMLVVCQTGPDDPLAQSVFLLQEGMAGVDASSMGEKLGMRMVPMSQVAFHSVRVPRDGMIGEWNSGHSQLKGFLDVVRIEAGAMGVGIAQGALDRALEYSRKREQFGKPIAAFDPVRNKLADMCAQVEMARLVVHKAAWSVDQGRPDARSILLSKMIASKAAYGVTHDALQIHGGLGYMTEGQVEHFFRDARVLDLFVEQGQREKNLLADLITGRPSVL